MTTNKKMTDEASDQPSRRGFLKAATAATGSAVLAACSPEVREVFLREKFSELSTEDKAARLKALEEEYGKKYGEPFEVTAQGPQAGVSFGYALDLSRCVGCRQCVYACAEENNLSREPQLHYITVFEMDKESGVDLSHGDPYYDAETVPQEGHFYLPVACQQCEDPACTRVCPVGATWRDDDGIVVIDYDWCIGCRYCMVACPYGARKFNWLAPNVPAKEVNPVTHYMGNRPRPRGVVEKCTWCVKRTREGRYPACVEVCPVGARKFGNLLDPKSEVRYVLENKRVFVLKQELNTKPKFYYFYGE